MSHADVPLALVLDTNVCLDLLLFADPAVAKLRAQLDAGRVQAFTRDDCRDEWRRVLGYSIWQLSTERQLQLMADFDRLMQPAPEIDNASTTLRLPRCRDPDDQKFLQLSAVVPALALISKDRDLLKLARSCRRHNHFEILSPQAWCAMDEQAQVSLWNDMQRRRNSASKGF